MRVYIAGPIGKGDLLANVRAAMDAADYLLDRGHAVYVPHLFTVQQVVHPRTHAEWLRQDLQWVRASDAVLRLPGASPGADQEAEFARDAGIPVFTSLKSLVAWAKEGEPQ